MTHGVRYQHHDIHEKKIDERENVHGTALSERRAAADWLDDDHWRLSDVSPRDLPSAGSTALVSRPIGPQAALVGAGTVARKVSQTAVPVIVPIPGRRGDSRAPKLVGVERVRSGGDVEAVLAGHIVVAAVATSARVRTTLGRHRRWRVSRLIRVETRCPRRTSVSAAVQIPQSKQ